MAMATPAMLPTPTREAVLTQNAWNELMPGVFVPMPETSRRTISGSMRSCTKRVENVNHNPQPTSTTMST